MSLCYTRYTCEWYNVVTMYFLLLLFLISEHLCDSRFPYELLGADVLSSDLHFITHKQGVL